MTRGRSSRFVVFIACIILTALLCFVHVLNAQGDGECQGQNTQLSAKERYANRMHSGLLPRTCGDVVSDEPRVVAVLWDGLEVLCDTETDGGGWLVIQRRNLGAENFFRNWADYKYGFGDITSEFWFGNEKVHRLTTQRRYELRVDFTFQDVDYYATYSHFRLYGEPENYKLEATGYRGDAGDSLSYHSEKPFSTKDRDHDGMAGKNCAETYFGAWWHWDCHQSNLNGHWGSKTYGEGVQWTATTGYYDTVTFSEMKIRPVE